MRRPDLALRFARGQRISDFDLEEVAKFIKSSSPTIVEAGACDGGDTRSMALRWPSGRVFAFEPHPALVTLARSTTADLPNVVINDLALAAKDDSFVDFFCFPDNETPHGSSSLLRPEDHLSLAPHVRFGKTIRVRATTLDTWYASIGMPTVDLLWLDLQGAELLVLNHGEHLLANTLACHIEVSREPLYADGARFHEVTAFFLKRGFTMAASRVPVRTGNAIYVRERHR